MSRADDIAKSKKLLKKWGIKGALKELFKTRADVKALKKLGSMKNATNYAEGVELSLAYAKYLNRKKDVKFLKSLPQGADDSLYEELPQKTKERIVDIVLSIRDNMEEKPKKDAEKIKSLNEKKEIIVKGRVARIKNKKDEIDSELDEWESMLPKTDFAFGWECALAMRQKIVDGDFGYPTDDVAINDAYRYAEKNCTINGENFEWKKLKKDYGNAKERVKAGKIIADFERKYYKKVDKK